MNNRNRTAGSQDKRWIITDEADRESLKRLAEELRIPIPIAEILLQRKIADFESARRFFRPSLDLLHDPSLMDGMQAATRRLLEALEKRESVCVYGDYDVDGTNATAMLYLFLRELGINVRYYIPDRIGEGYGLSTQGIDAARNQGVTLLVTVDCGITAVDQVRYAAEHGIDVIICDHHEVGDTVPPAAAVLDPLKPGDTYPFKGLCGCGVAFKLIQALARETGTEHLIPSFLEFVTLGTIADIVPLVDENRILVKIGLESLNATNREGIRALIRESGLAGKEISTGQVVFGLAPRINAVGRLGDANRAVRLLVSSEQNEAKELARVLEEENLRRRRIDERTFEEAVSLFEETDPEASEPAIVLHSDEWHPGVIGIVASRMVERYYRPAIMLATVDGVAKGSARSVPGFDLYSALSHCSEALLQFGGHKYAAGLTIDRDRVGEFARLFKETVGATITEDQKKPVIRIDAEVSFDDLTPRFIRILMEFAPFGPGNSKPVFLTRNVQLSGNPRIVGNNHLKCRVRQRNVVFDAIGFGLGGCLDLVRQWSDNLDLVYSIEQNDYRTYRGGYGEDPVPQLKIRDVREGTHGTESPDAPGHASRPETITRSNGGH